jgi:hypothetical protein
MYRIVYVAALCFVKLSILYFFKTIASHRTLRHVVNVTIGFVIVYSIGAIIAGIWQCRTPSDAWNVEAYFAQFDEVPNPNAPHVQCYDPVILFTATAALNLFSDLVILLIPQSQRSVTSKAGLDRRLLNRPARHHRIVYSDARNGAVG